MKPTVGRIVNFYPSDIDNEAKDNGAEVLPAVIVRVWSEETVNLKVLTDSDKGELWRTSVTKRPEGTVSPQNATWDWPVKIVMDKRTAFKLAKEEVASHSIYKRWENIEAELKGTEEYIDFLEIAAELWCLSERKRTWKEACEAQKQLCIESWKAGFIPTQAPKPEFKP